MMGFKFQPWMWTALGVLAAAVAGAGGWFLYKRRAQLTGPADAAPETWVLDARYKTMSTADQATAETFFAWLKKNSAAALNVYHKLGGTVPAQGKVFIGINSQVSDDTGMYEATWTAKLDGVEIAEKYLSNKKSYTRLYVDGVKA